jgi:thioredoxin reductase (NADPH)
MSEFDYDCLVIGGGPAGLTAAIYLVRYHLSLKVVDAGNSRASWIPCSHNHAGYPGGINGKELLRLMREQAQMYGASIETGRVTRLDRIEGGFRAEWGSGCVTARTVLLATGVTNRRPPMDEDLHDDALAKGLIRYCPVCDGFEVTDKKVGVIGSGSHGVAEAVFLRGFTEDVTLIAPDRAHDLSGEDQERLRQFGIAAVDGPCHAVAAAGECITIATPYGEHVFDSVYPALGSDTHTELAEQVGADIAIERAAGASGFFSFFTPHGEENLCLRAAVRPRPHQVLHVFAFERTIAERGPSYHLFRIRRERPGR